jgi:Alpha/beta hydrolase domain
MFPRRSTMLAARTAAVAAVCVAVLPGTASAHVTHSTASRVTSVTVASTTPVGRFNGADYVRVVGTLAGTVSRAEHVVGLTADTTYSAQFEVITAAPGQPRSDGVIVEAENRGSPLVFDAAQNLGLVTGPPSTIAFPAGLGNGFFQNAGLAWARVQWQGPNAAAVTNPTIPLGAQGVGEVIVRDFGLLLRGADGDLAHRAGLSTYDTAVLVGVSQSAWFVNTFIAEGFNEPNGRLRHGGVFAGAYTQDGVGNWLALNQINAARGFTSQTPYVQPNGVPLQPSELLSRPATDPFVVDTTAYTDFFRVRASLFNTARLPANLREWNVPAAHSSAAALPLGTTAAQVNCAPGLTPSPVLNPSDSRPYTRAAILSVARRVGVDRLRSDAPRVADSTRFALRPGPSEQSFAGGDPNLPLFNFLPGHDLRVPVTNRANQPVGGALFPDAVLSLGMPAPVSVPPVATRSILDTCGNFGGFVPFTATQLSARYGSVDRYARAYSFLLDRLIARGLVLRADRTAILDFARTRYLAAPAGQ